MKQLKLGMAAICLSLMPGSWSAAAEGRIAKAMLGTDSTGDLRIVNPVTVFPPDIEFLRRCFRVCRGRPVRGNHPHEVILIYD